MNFLRRLFKSERSNVFKSERPNVFKMKQHRDVKGLIKNLQNENSEIVIDCVRALGTLKSKEAVEHLSDLLDKTNNGKLQRALLYNLGQIADPRAANAVCKFLSHNEPALRHCAVRSFKTIRDQRSIDGIINYMKFDPTLGDSQDALVNQGEAAVEPLSELLECKDFEGKDSTVYLRATQAIRLIGTQKAIDTLIKALDNANPSVAGNAASQLRMYCGDYPSKCPVEALVDKLGRCKPEDRRTIFRVIEEVQDRAFIPLKRLINNKNVPQDLKDEVLKRIKKVKDLNNNYEQNTEDGEIAEIEIMVPVEDIKGSLFIKTEIEKSERDCISQTNYRNLGYSLLIVSLSKRNIIKDNNMHFFDEENISIDKGDYLWIEYAKGHGPVENGLIPIDVVDAIPFLLKLEFPYNGKISGLAEFVKGVANLPANIRQVITDWFSNSDHSPQWNRRPERVRKIVG